MSKLIETHTIGACLFALVLIAAYVSPIAGLTIAMRLIIVVAASVLAGLSLGLIATGVTITVVAGLAIVAEFTDGHPLSVGAMTRDAALLVIIQTVAIVTGYKLRRLVRYTPTRRP